MTYKKISLILLLSMLITILGACNSKAKEIQQQNAEMSFSETEIGKKAGLVRPSRIAMDSEGRIITYDAGMTAKRYVTLDMGGNVISEIQDNFAGEGGVFTIDAKDNIYVLAQTFTLDVNKNIEKASFRLYIFNNSKKLREVAVDAGGCKDMIVDIAVDSGGSIYLLDLRGNIYMADSTGRINGSIGPSGVKAIGIDPDGRLVAGIDAGRRGILLKLDCASGKTIWKVDTTVPAIDVLYNGKDKCIYTADSEGVKKYSDNGRDLGYIMKFDSYPSTGMYHFANTFLLDSVGRLYFATLDNSGAYRLLLYIPISGKSSGSSTGSKKEISVLVKQSDDFIRRAADTYEKKYPGTRVRIQPIEYLNESAEYKDYIQRLNTEIMSGKGPDIIEVSGLPYIRYVDRGALVNIDRFISEDDKTRDKTMYYTNVFDAFRVKDGLYAVPVGFYTYDSVFIADRESIKNTRLEKNPDVSWRDFFTACKELTRDTNADGASDTFALPNYSGFQVFMLQFQGKYRKYIDFDKKTASFNSPDFINLLNNCKVFLKYGVFNPQVEAYNMVKCEEAFGRNTVKLLQIGLTSCTSLFERELRYGKELALISVHDTGDDRIFNSDSVYGINSNCSYQTDAWMFIQLMISEEMQNNMYFGGFLVNRAGEEKDVAFWMSQPEHSGGRSTSINGENFDDLVVPKRAIIPIYEVVESLNAFCYNDTNLFTDLIYAEARKFFKDEKSAEETAVVIQNKVETYLNE